MFEFDIYTRIEYSQMCEKFPSLHRNWTLIEKLLK
jgi:hypothetical protein